MAVVSMNKLMLVGLNADKNQILSELMTLGVVEITSHDLTSSEWISQWSHLVTEEDRSDAIEALNGQIEQTAAALGRLARYNGGKKPLFAAKRSVSVSEFAAVETEHARLQEIVTDILRLGREQQELQNQRNKAENLIASLQPWQPLDIPLNFKGTEYTKVVLGVLPPSVDAEKVKSELTSEVPASYLEVVTHDKFQQYVFLIYHHQLQSAVDNVLKNFDFVPVSFSGMTGTAAERIREAEQEVKALDRAYQVKEAAIAAYAVEKFNLELYYDYLTGQRDKETALETLTNTESVFLIEGWLPAELSDEIKRRLNEQWTCVVEISEPAEDEEFPVLLENSSLGASVEGITAMYGLPNCRELDPNTIMAPFFIGFFGLMLGDGGYGVVMTLAALFALWKFDFDANMKKYAKLVLYCGIATMFWGLMFGSWFGIEYFGERPLWLNPTKEPEEMLKWSLLFGVLHIYVGIAVRGVNHIRNGKYIDVLWDVVAWYVLFTGFVFVVLPFVPAMTLEDTTFWVDLGKKMMAVGAVVLILTQGRENKGIISKLVSGVGSLYDLVSFLSDVLSYSRLLALGLATSIIGTIVNQIATMAGLNNIFKILVAAVIAIIGHSLNFAINALGAYVHSSRLQYIEFFGKFYQSGGKPFKPLKYKTKYVNLKN